jgi:hypothetical protein
VSEGRCLIDVQNVTKVRCSIDVQDVSKGLCLIYVQYMSKSGVRLMYRMCQKGDV